MKSKIVSMLLTIFVTMPIWYSLLYGILKRVDASEFMWLLFWVYIPVGFFNAILVKIAED